MHVINSNCLSEKMSTRLERRARRGVQRTERDIERILDIPMDEVTARSVPWWRGGLGRRRAW